MPEPISALELKPGELIREVSPEAIGFYADDLSGIYLPYDFKDKHTDVFDVEFWEPEKRLSGKFGRFALRHALADGESMDDPLDDVLLMGSTIGVAGLDRYQDMHSLYHRDLGLKVREVLEARNLIGRGLVVDAADYGSTYIKLGDNGEAETVHVSGKSSDFGRASADGRRATCEVFERLLGGETQVSNDEPEPRDRDKIVGSRSSAKRAV